MIRGLTPDKPAVAGQTSPIRTVVGLGLLLAGLAAACGLALFVRCAHWDLRLVIGLPYLLGLPFFLFATINMGWGRSRPTRRRVGTVVFVAALGAIAVSILAAPQLCRYDGDDVTEVSLILPPAPK